MDMMSYLMGKNSGGGGKGAKIEVVTELPEIGEANVIYLVPKETEDENNVFDEYLYINNEWELIGSTDIDISGKQDTMQFNTMPTPSIDYLGKIVQYTGITNANYTNGYFYVCVSETENNVTTYSWSNVEVQNAPDMSLYKSNVYFKNITLTSGSISSGAFNYNETDGEIVKILNNNASNNDVLLYLTTGNGFILYLPFLKNSFINHSTMQRSEGIIYGLNGFGSPYMALVGIRIDITWDNNQENISSIVIRNDSYNFSGLKKILNESETIETAKETIYKISNISAYTSGTTYPQGRYVYKIENKLVKLYKANTTTSSVWYPAEWNTKTYMEYLSDTLVGGALNGSY